MLWKLAEIEGWNYPNISGSISDIFLGLQVVCFTYKKNMAYTVSSICKPHRIRSKISCCSTKIKVGDRNAWLGPASIKAIFFGRIEY